jgi:spore coat-associated protein N
MSRIKLLAASPRRALAALATVLVAVGLTAASGANFSAQSANPGTTFTAGTLSMSNSLDDAAILTASNMRPGDPATKGKVDIQNTGSLSAPFVLSKGTVTNTDLANPMAGKLDVTVVDCGDFSAGTPTCGDAHDVVKYSGGTLAQMGTTGHAVAPLGTFAANEKHRYEFDVALAASADDSYQGGGATAQFLWNATS